MLTATTTKAAFASATATTVEYTVGNVTAGADCVVYDAATVGSVVSNVTAAVSGDKLTLTFTGDKINTAGTYYIETQKGGKKSATRLAVTTEKYVPTTDWESIIAAPLVDHATPAIPSNELATNYGIVGGSPTKDATSKVVTVALQATDLQKHTNGENTAGYWVGIAIPVPEGVTITNAKYAFGASASTTATTAFKDSDKWTKDGQEYVSFYADLTDPEAAKQFISIDWDGDGATYGVEQFVMNLEAVEKLPLIKDIAFTKATAEEMGDAPYQLYKIGYNRLVADTTVTLEIKDSNNKVLFRTKIDAAAANEGAYFQWAVRDYSPASGAMSPTGPDALAIERTNATILPVGAKFTCALIATKDGETQTLSSEELEVTQAMYNDVVYIDSTPYNGITATVGSRTAAGINVTLTGSNVVAGIPSGLESLFDAEQFNDDANSYTAFNFSKFLPVGAINIVQENPALALYASAATDFPDNKKTKDYTIEAADTDYAILLTASGSPIKVTITSGNTVTVYNITNSVGITPKTIAEDEAIANPPTPETPASGPSTDVPADGSTEPSNSAPEGPAPEQPADNPPSRIIAPSRVLYKTR